MAGLSQSPATPDKGRHPNESIRRTASGLLVLMACVFLLSRYFSAQHPVAGYVQAFAEAAMVGGLADWFAVTALFRHPLGLPIPHTAIIPRNKDRIGDSLALFIRGNFLTPAVVSRRMIRLDLASAIGRFLTQPDKDRKLAGRLRNGAAQLAADILDALDHDRMGGIVKAMLVNRIERLDLAPLLGQALAAAIQNDRHVPLMDAVIRRGRALLESNEHLIRQMVHERAGKILRWTGLDEKLANAILDGLLKLIVEMETSSDHPVRLRMQEGLAQLSVRLQSDPKVQRRVAAMRDEIVANPAMQSWIGGLWEQARGALLQVARNPHIVAVGTIGETLSHIGAGIERDVVLRRAMNRFFRRVAVGATARYGESIVRLVSDTIKGWDATTVTDRLERTVGRDLQYIRINGTLVGGLVGLAIHASERLL